MIQKLLEIGKARTLKTVETVKNVTTTTFSEIKKLAKEQLRISLDIGGREIKKGQVYEITVGTRPGLLKITSTPTSITGKIEYELKVINDQGETVITKHSDYIVRFRKILDTKNFAEHMFHVHEQDDGFTIAGIDFKIGDFFQDHAGEYYIKSFTIDPVKGLIITGMDCKTANNLVFKSSGLDFDFKRGKFAKITDTEFINNSLQRIKARIDFEEKYL
jgi:hypothetical protein